MKPIYPGWAGNLEPKLILIEGVANNLQVLSLVRIQDGLSDDVLAYSMPPVPVSATSLLVPPGNSV